MARSFGRITMNLAPIAARRVSAGMDAGSVTAPPICSSMTDTGHVAKAECCESASRDARSRESQRPEAEGASRDADR